MMISEWLVPLGPAWEGTVGDITLGNMGATFYTAFLTPNSTAADAILGPCPDPARASYRDPCTSLGGPRRPPGTSTNNQNDAYAAARSNHAGGVNVGMGDGNVRFVADNIDVNAWRALSTYTGGEVTSAP